MPKKEHLEGNPQLDENLIELHRHFAESHHSRANNAWETIKLSAVLCSALVSLSAYSMIYLYTSESFSKLALVDQIAVRAFLIIIPVSIGFVSWMCQRNFRRQCKRLYTQASIVIKLEEDLGLYAKRATIKNFKNDQWYLPDDWKDLCFSTSRKFVDHWMNEKDGFYQNMKLLFTIFIITSIVMVISEIVLIAIPYLPFP